MRIILATSLLILSYAAHSQNNPFFAITDCDNSIFEGVYHITGLNKGGAPCYVKGGSPTQTLEYRDVEGKWVFANYSSGMTPCVGTVATYSPFSKPVAPSVPILNVKPDVTGMCGAAVMIRAIPTLSQWSLINLALLLLILGTLVILRKPVYNSIL